jgi:hypothetical protein
MVENLEELKNAIATQTEVVRLLKENVSLSLSQSPDIFQSSPRPGKYVSVSLIKTAVRLLAREHHGMFTAKDAARIPSLLIGYAAQYDREVTGEICP